MDGCTLHMVPMSDLPASPAHDCQLCSAIPEREILLPLLAKLTKTQILAIIGAVREAVPHTHNTITFWLVSLPCWLSLFAVVA